MVRDAFAVAEAEERSGQPGKQVLEGILHALCLGLSLSTPHQALWVDWRQPPTMGFFGGGGSSAREQRMANKCCELRRRDS